MDKITEIIESYVPAALSDADKRIFRIEVATGLRALQLHMREAGEGGYSAEVKTLYPKPAPLLNETVKAIAAVYNELTALGNEAGRAAYTTLMSRATEQLIEHGQAAVGGVRA